MPDLNVAALLNNGALVVMSAAFLWLVKTVVNDIRHDLSELNEKTDRVIETLQRIERNGRPKPER